MGIARFELQARRAHRLQPLYRLQSLLYCVRGWRASVHRPGLTKRARTRPGPRAGQADSTSPRGRLRRLQSMLDCVSCGWLHFHGLARKWPAEDDLDRLPGESGARRNETDSTASLVRVHRVKVYPSRTPLPKEEQLAWK